MPKVQVYVSDDLRARLMAQEINTTKVCQEALEAAVLDPATPQAKLVQLRRMLRELEKALDVQAP